MKRELFILCILLIASITFLQCTKNKLTGEGECVPYEQLTNGWGQLIFAPSFPANELPYFNPNNSDEIIYRLADGETIQFDLIKYNLRTKEKENIFSGFFSNRPRWGKNDFILLNIKDSLGYNIYKISSNGEGLTPLTTSGNCFKPEWNFLGDKFIYQLSNNTPTLYIISDIEGNTIDTLYNVSTRGSWQHNELIANGTFKGLIISDPFQDTSELIYETNGVAQSSNGAEWLDNERVIWCHTTGIYLTNIVTGTTEIIKETCNADTYQLPTYAPDINKVIFQRMERIKTSEDSGITKLSFYMMNPNGTNEIEVEIPE